MLDEIKLRIQNKIKNKAQNPRRKWEKIPKELFRGSPASGEKIPQLKTKGFLALPVKHACCKSSASEG